MTVKVNIYSDKQQKTLFEFLGQMHFDNQNDGDFSLTDAQKQEVIQRDNDFLNGKTTARNWGEIKRDLRSVYR